MTRAIADTDHQHRTTGLTMTERTDQHRQQQLALPIFRVCSTRYTDSQRLALSQTLRARGIRPIQRWGWRSPMPAAQQLVLDLLQGQGLQVVPELLLRVRRYRVPGWPTHHRLDLALPGHGVAVEIDGHSHRALCRRERDLRREYDLHCWGWRVVRVTNELALAAPALVLQAVEQAIASDEPGTTVLRLRRGVPVVTWRPAVVGAHHQQLTLPLAPPPRIFAGATRFRMAIAGSCSTVRTA